MANTAKKRSFGTTMGVTSIIAILVILILIVFSALSITTSNADLRLSIKTAEATKAFYRADYDAERKLGEIHAEVVKGGDWMTAVKALDCTVEPAEAGQSVAFLIKIDENKDLNVELIVSPDGQIDCKEWQVVPSTEWTPDRDLNVITEFPLNR